MYEAHTNDTDTEAGPSTTSHVCVETTTSAHTEVSKFLFLFFFSFKETVTSPLNRDFIYLILVLQMQKYM